MFISSCISIYQDLILDGKRRYKLSLVDFIQAKPWHWFITIPIGMCPDDDIVINRLRKIEGILCAKYLVNRYQKLPDEKRFSMVVAFEGYIESGTRHAHILAFIPVPMKTATSQDLLVMTYPGEFRFLWQSFASVEDTTNKFDKQKQIHFIPATKATAIYTVKSVQFSNSPYSRFEFVTPPKFDKFSNENRLQISRADKMARRQLFSAR